MKNNSKNAQGILKSPEIYHLKTRKVIENFSVPNTGSVFSVDKSNFPILEDITCYTVEVWEECMRLPHWHPNAYELGYVASGTIEVMIWRSPGEAAVMTLGPGMCWFIPKSALHSLNNVSAERAQLIIGFSSDMPEDIDLPVAFNGIPAPLRDAYTSPHHALRTWTGTTQNFFFGRFPVIPELKKVICASPYGIDLAQVPPLFANQQMGSVVWAIKSNWNILEEISILRAHLKPGIARDAIWYPDVGTLYIVSKGQAQFHIVIKDFNPTPITVGYLDFIFIPCGILHSFINMSDDDFEIIAFFSKANPLPEVSLSVATAFFPKIVRNAALTQYGNENKSDKPLENLNFPTQSPYLLSIKK